MLRRSKAGRGALGFRRDPQRTGSNLKNRHAGILNDECGSLRCDRLRIRGRMQDLTDAAMPARPVRQMIVAHEDHTNRRVKDHEERSDSPEFHVAAYSLLEQGCQATDSKLKSSCRHRMRGTDFSTISMSGLVRSTSRLYCALLNHRIII